MPSTVLIVVRPKMGDPVHRKYNVPQNIIPQNFTLQITSHSSKKGSNKNKHTHIHTRMSSAFLSVCFLFQRARCTVTELSLHSVTVPEARPLGVSVAIKTVAAFSSSSFWGGGGCLKNNLVVTNTYLCIYCYWFS